MAVEQQFGALKTQPVEQLLIAAARLLQVAAQGTRSAVQLLGQLGQAGRCFQLLLQLCTEVADQR